MKIGFIGAGKAGCSLGKYFAQQTGQVDVQVAGYYSLKDSETEWAAAFTQSRAFSEPEDVANASDAIIFSTPDGAIKNAWNALEQTDLHGKIICHLSGSLSSDVFSGVDARGAYAVSIHPLFAFSDKESVYTQLHDVCFTLEGHSYAVNRMQSLLIACGNRCVCIRKEDKPRYHAAASILSNDVVALLDTGYRLLVACGFSDEEARSCSKALVLQNVEHVIADGAVNALTGPVERADAETVAGHLRVLDGPEKTLYRACGHILVGLAKQKHPEREYAKIQELFEAE